MPKQRISLPQFELPSTEGRNIGPGPFRQRQNLVIAVLPDIDTDFARKVVEHLENNHARCRKLEAAVLVVAGGAAGKAQSLHNERRPPFPFLFDPDRSVCSKLGADGEENRYAVWVVDRFGTVWSRNSASDSGDPSTLVDEALKDLNFINLQCPECGVPDTPPPAG